MTKQDHRAIADILRICGLASPAEQRRQIICELANLFKRDDRSFNQREFLDAAGLPR